MEKINIILQKAYQLVKSSFCGRTAKWLFSPETRIFTLTLGYYLSLYFSINNRSLLILSFIYLLILWRIVKNFKLALFLTFIATLPFAKGKGFQIILLPKNQISRWVLFKISYFFPLYLADFFLILLIYIYIRGKLFNRFTTPLPSQLIVPLVLFLIFTLSTITASLGVFPDVILLSAIQLIKLLIVFTAIFLVGVKGTKWFLYVYSIASASVIFQSLWVILQRLNSGPLGKDIEVFIPGTEFGIRSSENVELFRSTGTFFEPSILGTYLLMHISLLTIIILTRKISSKVQSIYIISIILGLIALVFTGSRALYLLTLVSVGAIGYLHREKLVTIFARINMKKLILPAIGIGFIILPYVLNRLSSLPSIFAQYGTATYRLEMMQYAIRLAQVNPLFGVGINLSPYYLATAFPQEKFVFDPTYPHNLIFQLLAETGIVGTVLFLLFLYAVFRNALMPKQNHINEFGVAALVFLLCAQIYPIFLNHPEILSFLFLYLGFFLYTLPNRENSLQYRYDSRRSKKVLVTRSR